MFGYSFIDTLRNRNEIKVRLIDVYLMVILTKYDWHLTLKYFKFGRIPFGVLCPLKEFQKYKPHFRVLEVTYYGPSQLSANFPSKLFFAIDVFSSEVEIFEGENPTKMFLVILEFLFLLH